MLPLLRADKDRDWRALSRIMGAAADPAGRLAAEQASFTSLDAMTYHLMGAHGFHPDYTDPRCYYPSRSAELVATCTATSPETKMALLHQACPDLARSGAHVPEKLPFESAALELARECYRPELMLREPLPYVLGQPLDETDFIADPAAFLDRRRQRVALACAQRGATDAQFSRMANSIGENMNYYARRADADLAPDDMQAMTDLRGVLSEQAGHEEDRLRAADAARVQRFVGDTAALQGLLDMKQRAAQAQFELRLQDYGTGLYPGLLDVQQYGEAGVDGILVDGAVRERRFLISHFQKQQSGASSASAAAAMLPADADGIQRLVDSDAADIVPITYGRGALATVPEDAFEAFDAPADNVLLEEAFELQSRSGIWSAVPRALVEQEAILQVPIFLLPPPPPTTSLPKTDAHHQRGPIR